MAAPAPPDPLFRTAEVAARLLCRWHRAELDGAARVPDGPALLVGNHGLFGLETPVFLWLLRRATGRTPWALADRALLGGPLARPFRRWVRSVPRTFGNARRLLADGHLLVSYPGGARETFKGPHDRHRVRWERSLSFARLAIAAQVPVVPFAGLGVDDGFVNLGRVRAARALLGRRASPLALGVGPLPWPARLHFVLGRPIAPPADPSGAALLRAAAERAVLTLLASHGTHAVPARPAAVVP
ncbi:MAG TPA: 1-acyl-sn-glycerol-3-phosphate acyltransferase [Anaeromyxobacteraceae bacterium]|nr:1-acyl-sn-glycerol-3-phosphate acyltransferase [Anaeromyxobacteraceae bacterium]